jgi:hypothetical protein
LVSGFLIGEKIIEECEFAEIRTKEELEDAGLKLVASWDV